jgi:2-keto-4-pentenoate hydratase/2-oxohepta-3-ene-1,7-dioic acid hydratase in catechol pathway
MRLIRLGLAGKERPHLLTADNRVVDVTDLVGDFDPEFFDRDGISELRQLQVGLSKSAVALPRDRLGSPVTRPGKIVGIALNYSDHARESDLPVPDEPVFFLKASNALCGPNDDVWIPRGSMKTDWEVELGVVVGRTCRYLESDEDAIEAIAGYMVCNDVSEREFQLERGSQWVKGKSCERFNPAGPWLVTSEEVPDPRSLELWLDVNGRRMQTATAREMVFGVAAILRSLSQYMVLDPGDIINTGTPSGVALGMPNQPFLRPGDLVELGITGLGNQRQRMAPAP